MQRLLEKEEGSVEVAVRGARMYVEAPHTHTHERPPKKRPSRLRLRSFAPVPDPQRTRRPIRIFSPPGPKLYLNLTHTAVQSSNSNDCPALLSSSHNPIIPSHLWQRLSHVISLLILSLILLIHRYFLPLSHTHSGNAGTSPNSKTPRQKPLWRQYDDDDSTAAVASHTLFSFFTLIIMHTSQLDRSG